MSAQLQDSHILNVKQQRKHFVCDWPKSLQLHQERMINCSQNISWTIVTKYCLQLRQEIYIYMSCQTYLEYIISKLLN